MPITSDESSALEVQEMQSLKDRMCDPIVEVDDGISVTKAVNKTT